MSAFETFVHEHKIRIALNKRLVELLDRYNDGTLPFEYKPAVDRDLDSALHTFIYQQAFPTSHEGVVTQHIKKRIEELLQSRGVDTVVATEVKKWVTQNVRTLIKHTFDAYVRERVRELSRASIDEYIADALIDPETQLMLREAVAEVLFVRKTKKR